MRIGVDLMGGDLPPSRLIHAVFLAAQHLQQVHFEVYVTPDAAAYIQEDVVNIELLRQHSNTIHFHLSQHSIEQEDLPLSVLRSKRDSTMAAGVEALAQGRSQAFVSVGNTGSLVSSATLRLPRLKTFKRPGLLISVPTGKGETAVLDVGGNVSCRAEHLIQFATLGAAYQRSMQGIAKPKVGLLNIGSESKKGTTTLQEAYAWLESHPSEYFEFFGNVEGGDVFKGYVDVLVTDGFTGNVFLKTVEGVAQLLLGQISQASEGNVLSPDVWNKFNYKEYGGAVLVGLKGLVIKCHGSVSEQSLLKGLLGAASMIQMGLLSKLSQEL